MSHLTAPLPRLLLALWLCLTLGSLAAQQKTDTVPQPHIGLRLLNFNAQEDNYTGFDDGSERKLNRALGELNDKFSSAVQAQFKAYDLGLYRLGNGDATQSGQAVSIYVDQAKNLSEYYIVLAKLWTGQQRLSDLKVYLRLPNDLPVFKGYSTKELEAKAAQFILEEYKARNFDESRLKQAEAAGIERISDFIHKPIRFKALDGVSFSSPNGALSSDVFTFMTPSGELIVLPNGYEGKWFTTCNDKYNVPGALAAFNLYGKRYYGWVDYDSDPVSFHGYAERNGDQPAAFHDTLAFNYRSGITPSQIHIAIAEAPSSTGAGAKLVAKVGESENPNLWENGKYTPLKSPLPIKNLVYQTLPIDQYSGACWSVKSLPDQPFGKKFEDINVPEATASPLPTFDANKPFLDFTGMLGGWASSLNDYAGNKTCVVVTSSETPQDKLQGIIDGVANKATLPRVVVWVHIDKDGVPKQKVIVPTALENSGITAGVISKIMGQSEQASSFKSGDLADDKAMPSSHKAPDQGHQMLNFFGGFRLMLSAATEFLANLNPDEPKYWDANAPDYFLKDAGFGFVLKGSGFDKIVALGCGVVSGVVSNAQGAVDAVSSKAQMVEFLFDEAVRNKILGELAETWAAVEDPAMRSFMFAAIKKQISEEISSLNTNTYKRWFYAGKLPTEIAVGAALGVTGKKVADFFGLGQVADFRVLFKSARSMFKAVPTPKIKALLVRFIRMPNVTILPTGDKKWILKQGSTEIKINDTGQMEVQLDGDGNMVSPVTSSPPVPFDHVETMPTDKNRTVEVVEGSAGNDRGKMALIAGWLPDDIIRRILARNNFALTPEAVSSDDVTWFRQSVVGKIGSDNAEKFLKDEYAERLSAKLGVNNVAQKRALFQDLGDSYHDPNGIGRLLDGDGFTDGVVEAWKDLLSKPQWRTNAKYINKLSRYKSKGLTVTQTNGEFIMKQTNGVEVGKLDPNDAYNPGEMKVLGKSSGRHFDPDDAGGLIVKKSWANPTISQQGIDNIVTHLNRFGPNEENANMIKRLNKIKNGEISITDYDKRFYTHELEEYARYQNKGVSNGVNDADFYYNAHAASLESYSINELTSPLYHP